jgi:adenosylhomocysteine nucleosidase
MVPRSCPTRRATALALALSLALTGIAGCTSGARSAGSGQQGSHSPAAPIGVVDPAPQEQAPVLAAMRVQRSQVIGGYRFWVGTIDGVPVVDVGSGELDETAELATYLLDTNYHPRLVLLSGTAGAQNAAVNVGDVVLSGYVVDKSSIHYQQGGYQSPYRGIEIHLSDHSDIAGAIISQAAKPYPDPGNARTFGAGPSTSDTTWAFVDALAASREALTVAEAAGPSLGLTTLATAAGTPQPGGSIVNKVVSGVIGQADIWTEPLSWIAAQNFLYQTDAEENEGSGFAFSNAQLGVPWLIVRGIADTPWHPQAYDGVIASQHAATIVRYVVGHLRKQLGRAPATMSDLSNMANARLAGYLVATKAYFGVGPVTQIEYRDASGQPVTMSGSKLAQLQGEYTYGASKLGP